VEAGEDEERGSLCVGMRFYPERTSGPFLAPFTEFPTPCQTEIRDLVHMGVVRPSATSGTMKRYRYINPSASITFPDPALMILEGVIASKFFFYSCLFRIEISK
jgi:hypothetical protein